MKRLSAIFLMAVCGLVTDARAEFYETAVLQELDKVTARVTTVSVPIGEEVRFGTLKIIVRACDKRPPEETPESAIFLDIWEVRPGDPEVSIFSGWMFASSPALNALEHPVYDVWALDCKDKRAISDATSSSDQSPLSPPKPE